jgi:DNA uptake protein ComE-like DNA-binding protein
LPIDINSASRAQLKTLPGIGDEQVDRIVKHRPYLSKADLVVAGAIPAGTYLAIKQRIVALQKLPLKVKG